MTALADAITALELETPWSDPAAVHFGGSDEFDRDELNRLAAMRQVETEPVVRSFQFPALPTLPDGAAFSRFVVEPGRGWTRTEKTLDKAVDEWLARGTDSTLYAEAERYVPGAVDDDAAGSWMFHAVYDAVKQQWMPWKAA